MSGLVFLSPAEGCIPITEVLFSPRRIRVLVHNNKIKHFPAAKLVLVKHASFPEEKKRKKKKKEQKQGAQSLCVH